MAASTNHISLISPPDVYNTGTYAHASVSQGPTRLIHTAGQLGRDINGHIPETIDQQCEILFANLGKCLAAAGATMRHVLHANIYVVNWNRGNSPVIRYFTGFFTDEQGNHPVPTTLIPVPCLARPEALIEVNVVASVPI